MASDEEERELEARLKELRGDKSPRAARGGPASGLVIAALSVIAAAAVFFVATYAQRQSGQGALETSEVSQFQQPGGSAGRLQFPDDGDLGQRVENALIRVEEALEPEPAPEAAPVIPAPPATDPELAAELEGLRNALAELTEERNAEISQAVTELRSAFDEQRTALEEQLSESQRAIEAAQRESEAALNAAQTMLETERAQRAALEEQIASQEADSASERARLEREAAERERVLAAQRAQDQVYAEQVAAPALVFPSGGGGSSPASGGSGAVQYSDNELFLRDAPPLTVAEAQRMATPDRTLAQGTIIQAALRGAINSDLPGNVSAVVTEPVEAFSGNRILVPAGSRLFGAYRSDIEVNQKRILIVWSRILTPDGTSMQISAVGGDQLGRSGLTGFVDTKFVARFGGAALISLIGSAPAVAANQAEDDISRDVLVNTAEDLEDATDNVIAEQISISPTIYVDQGATVTVIVDRDVVVF